MERINQFDFYSLGRAFATLKAYSGEVAVSRAIFDLITCQTSLRRLLDGDPVPLGVSRSPAQSLCRELDEILERHCGGEKGFKWPDGSEPPIPDWRWKFFGNLLDTFETVFAEEMREATTYFVPRRGIFHTPILVDAADQTFPADVVSHVPDKTRADWRAAGRCLAFNLLSASGFHVARAVEGTLEAYYQVLSGKAGQTLDNWGQYLQHLETIQTSGASPSPTDRTLAELRQMKDDFRNPIVHPRVVLTESDAKVLFNNGESLIIAMAQEIKDASKGVQLALVQQGGSMP